MPIPLLAVLGYVAAVMGFVTFMEFIFEEALQTIAMGMWVAIQAKDWDTAKRKLQEYKALIDKVEFVVNTAGWLSPLNREAFVSFVNAARSQAEAYEAAINKHDTSIPKPKPIATKEEIRKKLGQPEKPEPEAEKEKMEARALLYEREEPLPKTQPQIPAGSGFLGFVWATSKKEAKQEAISRFGITDIEVDRYTPGPDMYAVFRKGAGEILPTPEITPTPTPAPTPTPTPQPTPAPIEKYPKTISRGQYSFTANNEKEEALLKEFLGIEPAGLDMDTWLAQRTDQELDQWRDFWIDKFSEVGRQDLVDFVNKRYEQEKAKRQKPIQAPEGTKEVKRIKIDKDTYIRIDSVWPGSETTLTVNFFINSIQQPFSIPREEGIKLYVTTKDKKWVLGVGGHLPTTLIKAPNEIVFSYGK